MDKKRIIALIDFIEKKAEEINFDCEYYHPEVSEIIDTCDEIVRLL